MSDENMQDYVYIKIKLSLKESQTEEELQDIVQELDYSVTHEQIIDTEIKSVSLRNDLPAYAFQRLYNP